MELRHKGFMATEKEFLVIEYSDFDEESSQITEGK